MKRFLLAFLLLLLFFPVPSHALPQQNVTAIVTPEAVVNPIAIALPDQTSVSTSGSVVQAFSADVTGDGVPEVVTIEKSSGTRYVGVYSKSGTQIASIELSGHPLDVKVHDVDTNTTGNEILVAYNDTAGLHIAAYHADGSLYASADLSSSQSKKAEIVVGDHYIYVVSVIGSDVYVFALEYTIKLIGSANVGGTNYELYAYGDVNVLVVSSMAYYFTVTYNPGTLSKEPSLEMISNNFQKASLSTYIIVRANGRIYYITYNYDSATGGYVVNVSNVGAYTNVGVAIGLNATDLIVSDGSSVIRFHYLVSEVARENYTTSVSGEVYALKSLDYNKNDTSEYLAFSSYGIYALALTSSGATGLQAIELVTYETTVLNFKSVVERDLDGDGYVGFIIIASPTVLVRNAGGSLSVEATINVNVNEFAIGQNGLYILDSYGNLYLYGYDGTLKASIGEDKIGIDSDLSHIRTLYPESKEVLFARSANGFIALNGTTLLPIRHLVASPNIRLTIKPNYLFYVETGSMYYELVSLDHTAPSIDATLDKVYYNPWEKFSLYITASDNVYLYELSYEIYNESGTLHSDTIGVYSASLETTIEFNITELGLAPGSYNIRVSISDGDGLVAEAEVSFTVDDGEAPSIEFLGQQVYYGDINSTLYLPFSITDDTPVEVDIYYAFNNDSRKEASYSVEGDIYNASITLEAYGYLHVRVVATDSAGNQNELEITVIVDDGDAPDITFYGFQDTYEVYSVVSGLIKVIDPTLASVQINVYYPGGVAQDVQIVRVNDTFRKVTFNVTLLGHRSINVTAKDLAQLTSESSRALNVVDTQPPRILKFEYPHIAETNETFSVYIEVDDNYYDNLTVRILVDNLLLYNGTVSGNASIALAVPISGELSLNVTVIDGSGNSVSELYPIIVDDGKPPSIAINAPSSIEVFGTYNVSITIEDDFLESVNVTLVIHDLLSGSNSSQQLVINGNESYYERPMEFYVVGNYTIIVEAVDIADNRAVMNHTIVVYDDVEPSVEIVYPEGTVDVGQMILVNITAVDNYRIGGIKVLFEGSEVSYEVISENDTAIIITVPLIFSEPGDYNFTVIAYDAIGNEVQEGFTIHVEDLTPPQLELRVPSSREVMESFTITITASDNYVVSQVIVYYSRNGTREKLATFYSGGEHTVSFLPDQLGTLSIKAEALDPAGHVTTKTAQVLIYDDIAPKIERVDVIGTLRNGENITISAIVSDNYLVDHVEIYVSYDNSTRQKLEVHELDGKYVAYYIPEESGTLYVKVVAYDVAGNESAKVLSVSIATNYTAAFMAAIVVILFIALLLLAFRRRGSRVFSSTFLCYSHARKMITRRKRKKSRKMRGRTRHQGRGVTKGHKKHGIRGGKGMANRDNAEKLKRLKLKPEKFIGKYGFTSPKAYRGINVYKYKSNVVNVGRLDAMAEFIGEKKEDAYVIDLRKLGIRKLLGSGRVSKKLIVYVDEASEAAVEKIKAAGGEVILSEAAVSG